MVTALFRAAWAVCEVGVLAIWLPLALLARFVPKRLDVGLGPEPLLNNVHHKKALQGAGYTAETFVAQVYYITSEFDIRADRFFPRQFGLLGRLLALLYLSLLTLFRYRCLYIYFHGGPLGLLGVWIWRFEPFLLHLAGVKVVVMPYGSDVQVMTRSPNLLFRHVMSADYPQQGRRRRRIAAQIDLWTRHADHIISGCEWVYYLPRWDTLTLGHFSIDTEAWRPASPAPRPEGPLRVLHAPNHRQIKGTDHFVQAVDELRAEGLAVELVILERTSNENVREVMASVDVVADQLVIGWYALFAIEAMAMEKPVLCYVRDDLHLLYVAAGLLTPGELPLVNCSLFTVRDVLRDLITNRAQLAEIGQRSRAYVLKHHSTEAVGRTFDTINRSLNVLPPA